MYSFTVHCHNYCEKFDFKAFRGIFRSSNKFSSHSSIHLWLRRRVRDHSWGASLLRPQILQSQHLVEDSAYFLPINRAAKQRL